MGNLIITENEKRLTELCKEAAELYYYEQERVPNIGEYIAKYLEKNNVIVATEETVKQYGAKVADDLYQSGFRSVVLCRECEHLGFKDFDGVCRGGPMCGIVKPWDYCSHGVKKEKGAGNG